MWLNSSVFVCGCVCVWVVPSIITTQTVVHMVVSLYIVTAQQTVMRWREREWRKNVERGLSMYWCVYVCDNHMKSSRSRSWRRHSKLQYSHVFKFVAMMPCVNFYEFDKTKNKRKMQNILWLRAKSNKFYWRKILGNWALIWRKSCWSLENSLRAELMTSFILQKTNESSC